MTLITSRKDPSEAKARRAAKGKEKKYKREKEKKRGKEGHDAAIITAVRNSAFLSVVMPRRGSRGNRDEGPGGLETKFGTSDVPDDILYADAETGSANGEIRAPARKSTLQIAALAAGNLPINRDPGIA